MFTRFLSRVLLAVLLLGLPSIVRSAETKPAPGPNPAERMEKLIEVLELTNEQQWKLQDEYRYQMERGREIQSDTNLTREQKEEELKVIRENIELKMKEILTPAQLTKWQSLRDKMQAAQPQASAGVRNRLEALATELKLTDEQKLKLKDVFQGPTEKIKELRANTNLTPEQKMKEYQAIQEKVDPQVKEILTPEQFAKWQAEREKWRAEMRQKLGKQQSSDK